MNSVEEQMAVIQNSNNDYLYVGIYKIDGRNHGFLQSKTTSKILSIYESKDGIYDDGTPEICDYEYQNLNEFLKDFTLVF